MKPCALKVATYEGSSFLIRFDQVGTEGGYPYGHIHIIGFSRSINEQIEYRGIGFRPEEGSRVILYSGKPRMEEENGEVFPVYPFEVIHSVVELDLKKILPRPS